MSHLVLRVSSCGVLVLFLVGFVLLFLGKTPGFLLSLILQNVGIANQRQNVLMTVRASSVHGMSSKKNYMVSPRPKLVGCLLSNFQAVEHLVSRVSPANFGQFFIVHLLIVGAPVLVPGCTFVAGISTPNDYFASNFILLSCTVDDLTPE